MDLTEFNINHFQSIRSVTEFGYVKTMEFIELSSLTLTISDNFDLKVVIYEQLTTLK